MTLGWYVHHQGRGHLTRAAAIARHVAADVTVLSSLPEPAAFGGGDHPGRLPPPRPGWVELERDDAGGAAVDPTAHGRLHWVPVGDAGLRGRMAAIADWITATRPSAIVVDVSVEVAVLARLFGVPVVVVAGPGERDDAPHQLAYGVAERILAPWPRAVYDPDFLHAYAHKTHYVGAISRFDDLAADARRSGARVTDDVVVLAGAGGTSVTDAHLDRARSAVPGRRWTGLGVTSAGWTDEIWPRLASAGVVVTHGGQNALAEAAAARRPTVIVPQRRPFGEQVQVAAALHEHGIAVTSSDWPTGADWPRLIDRALALGGSRWARWSTGHGAQDAAAVIDEVASG